MTRSSRWLVALGALVLGAVVFWLTFGTVLPSERDAATKPVAVHESGVDSPNDPPRTTEVPAVRVREDARVAPETEDGNKEGAAKLISPPPAGFVVSRATPTSARIHGTWTDARQRPAGYQRVRLFALGAGSEIASQMMVSTDAEGAYQAHAEPGRYRVAFLDVSYTLSLSPGEARRLDHRDLQGCVVRVDVAGPGIQLHNALVRIRSAAADSGTQEQIGRTDAQGKVVFESVRPGPAVVEGHLIPRHGGATIPVSSELEVPSAGEVRVSLGPPPGCLALTILARDGVPIGGVTLEMLGSGRSPSHRATTNPAGQVFLDGLPVGPVRIRLRHPQFAPKDVDAIASTKPDPMLVTLDAGARLPVRVTDDSGRPMEIVLRARTPGDAPLDWEWRLDADGCAMLTGLPADAMDLEFLAAGCESIKLNLGRDVLSKQRLDLRFKRIWKLPS